MRVILSLVCVLALSLCLVGCGKKPDRLLYDDGPAIDNGTYGVNSEVLEGDPYADGLIDDEYALEILNRYYGNFNSELNLYVKFGFDGTVTRDGEDWYRFKMNTSKTEDGVYTFNKYAYYKTDGSRISFDK